MRKKETAKGSVEELTQSVVAYIQSKFGWK